MNKEQEYNKFWMSLIDKINEIQKDYNNLSEENKHRADSVKNVVIRAHSLEEAIQIVRSQIL